MISLREVEGRLARAGFHNRFWGRAEVRELPNILTEDEEIHRAVNGIYEGGIAMLVATNRRLLLIDKKPLFMTMEDIRYDMISEVNYFSNVFDAGVAIKTINTTLVFKTWRQKMLRLLCADVQQRVMALRQNHIEAENRIAAEARNLEQQYDGRNASREDGAYPEPASQPASYPMQSVSSEQQRPPFMLNAPRPGYPSGPLMVRRRTGRFYPSAGSSTYS